MSNKAFEHALDLGFVVCKKQMDELADRSISIVEVYEFFEVDGFNYKATYTIFLGEDPYFNIKVKGIKTKYLKTEKFIGLL